MHDTYRILIHIGIKMTTNDLRILLFAKGSLIRLYFCN